MENKSSDPIPVCVLKVDVNCCEGCKVKLKKKLLSLRGVLLAEYDSSKKLAMVKGLCQPYVLVNCIKKMGKVAEVVYYSKDDDDEPTPKPPTTTTITTTTDKSCEAKGKENENASSSSATHNNDCVDKSSVICKDELCREDENMNGSMHYNWNHHPPPGYGFWPDQSANNFFHDDNPAGVCNVM